MTKYQNTKTWLEPVRIYDPGFSSAIEAIHRAICLADDIADRVEKPSKVSRCLWEGMAGVSRVFKTRPSDAERIIPVLCQIYESECLNMEFRPGCFDLETEFGIWEKRSSLLNLYFKAWTIVDPTFDTEENWKWLKKFSKFCLIHNDCDDIIDERFEDLHQCRRNYVVFQFGTDAYFGWQKIKDQLVSRAKEIKKSLEIEDPSDERMKAFMRG